MQCSDKDLTVECKMLLPARAATGPQRYANWEEGAALNTVLKSLKKTSGHVCDVCQRLLLAFQPSAATRQPLSSIHQSYPPGERKKGKGWGVQSSRGKQRTPGQQCPSLCVASVLSCVSCRVGSAFLRMLVHPCRGSTGSRPSEKASRSSSAKGTWRVLSPAKPRA